MKILSVSPLTLSDAKIIRIARFADERGYFTETLRAGDLAIVSEIPYFQKATWHQINESYSKKNVARGLHFQWEPHMGKYVRATEGTLIDLVLDIRTNSPTFGAITGYKLEYRAQDEYQDVVWVPPGCAHGFVAITECRMEYVCTGWWAPQTERAITMFDTSLDWSYMNATLAQEVQSILPHAHMAEKDRNGMTLAQWKAHPDSQQFMASLPV